VAFELRREKAISSYSKKNLDIPPPGRYKIRLNKKIVSYFSTKSLMEDEENENEKENIGRVVDSGSPERRGNVCSLRRERVRN
jgi:hypothetical protein